jgi:hypothetical protein
MAISFEIGQKLKLFLGTFLEKVKTLENKQKLRLFLASQGKVVYNNVKMPTPRVRGKKMGGIHHELQEHVH